MRILLADDQPRVRFALNALLKRKPDIHVVGEASHVEDLLAKIASTNPDLLLLDWRLPGFAEIGSIKRLREDQPNLIIIALSGRPELGKAALGAGANAFVSKIDPPDKLLAIITSYQHELDKVNAGTNL